MHPRHLPALAPLMIALAAGGLVAGANAPPARTLSTVLTPATVAHGRHTAIPVSHQRPDRSGRDPHQGNPAAIAEGAKLFIAYNCADCHGPDGSGLVGPSLQDGRWRYGGSPDEIYRSIAEGRPDGMPRWQSRIPANQIRQLVAYVSTLAASKDVTTENFTEQGVQRTGH